jgi:hypothetical protein
MESQDVIFTWLQPVTILEEDMTQKATVTSQRAPFPHCEWARVTIQKRQLLFPP